jgi:hypothetical protein
MPPVLAGRGQVAQTKTANPSAESPRRPRSERALDRRQRRWLAGLDVEDGRRADVIDPTGQHPDQCRDFNR